MAGRGETSARTASGGVREVKTAEMQSSIYHWISFHDDRAAA